MNCLKVFVTAPVTGYVLIPKTQITGVFPIALSGVRIPVYYAGKCELRTLDQNYEVPYALGVVHEMLLMDGKDGRLADSGFRHFRYGGLTGMHRTGGDDLFVSPLFWRSEEFGDSTHQVGPLGLADYNFGNGRAEWLNREGVKELQVLVEMEPVECLHRSVEIEGAMG